MEFGIKLNKNLTFCQNKNSLKKNNISPLEKKEKFEGNDKLKPNSI